MFRIGFVLTPAVFAMQAAIVYSANRVFSSKIGLALGTISSMCLMVVAVVNEEENLKVHCGNRTLNFHYLLSLVDLIMLLYLQFLQLDFSAYS